MVIPLTTQHYPMLQRNLVYTGVTRGKQLVVVVGQRKAMAIAVKGASSPHTSSSRQSHDQRSQLPIGDAGTGVRQLANCNGLKTILLDFVYGITDHNDQGRRTSVKSGTSATSPQNG